MSSIFDAEIEGEAINGSIPPPAPPDQKFVDGHSKAVGARLPDLPKEQHAIEKKKFLRQLLSRAKGEVHSYLPGCGKKQVRNVSRDQGSNIIKVFM